MGTLVTRLTLLAAGIAAALAGAITVVAQAAWPLVLLRSLTAFGIVAAVGFGFRLVLTRTALRRYYEESRRLKGATRRASGNR
ncbi:MAG TPA: hypothetical protein VF363_04660 [Candidatus Eisenbacteria bacterium]